MPKVTFPLGSESAHGKLADALVFRGDIVSQYVKPRQPRSEAQISVRDDFRLINKLFSRCGKFSRAVFRKEFGARWFQFLYGRVKSNWNNSYQDAVDEFDAFSEGSQNAWDSASPYRAGVQGMGRYFYATLRTCFHSLLDGSGNDWGMTLFGGGGSSFAYQWWVEPATQCFLPGLFDDNDSRIKYFVDWNEAEEENAIQGGYHYGNVEGSSYCQFYFIGNVLKIHYPTFLGAGGMYVIIDGDDAVSSDISVHSGFGSVWTSVVLEDGLHDVEIAQSGIETIGLDGIQIS